MKRGALKAPQGVAVDLCEALGAGFGERQTRYCRQQAKGVEDGRNSRRARSQDSLLFENILGGGVILLLFTAAFLQKVDVALASKTH